MGRDARDRVTVELRGLRKRLNARSLAHRVTTAAAVRKALLAWLDDEPNECDVCPMNATGGVDGEISKVTLRLPMACAIALSRRARAADLSQGAYVAHLIDGAPSLVLTADRRPAIAALGRSTDQLAAMCTDLNAVVRLVSQGRPDEAERLRARFVPLFDDVRAHIAMAASLVAELRPPRRPR